MEDVVASCCGTVMPSGQFRPKRTHPPHRSADPVDKHLFVKNMCLYEWFMNSDDNNNTFVSFGFLPFYVGLMFVSCIDWI